MESANMTRLLSLVLIVGLCCTSIAMSAQTIVRGGAPQQANRVHLIMGADPQFDSLVRQHLPEVAASVRYQAMKATSVVIANDTPFQVKAIALKWSITQADGTQSISYSCICPQPSGRIFLPGRLPALLPSHVALASPLGYAAQSATGHTVNAAVTDAAYANSSSAPAVLGAQKLAVSIDGIIFDNDSVVGPDTFGLADKFACERNGAIAEAQSLQSLPNDPAALTHQLNIDAALRGNAGNGACASGRASEARRLLDLQQSGGMKAVTLAIQRLAAARVVSLRHR